MNSLSEIEAAAHQLTAEEQCELLLRLAEHLEKIQATPKPRTFTKEQMQQWFDDDEREGREIRELLGR